MLNEYFVVEIYVGMCYHKDFTTSLNFNNWWHMWIMEEDLVIELCVCSYHVYKDMWEAAIGEKLPCEWETRNTKDRYAVALKKKKRRHGGWTSTEKNLPLLFYEEETLFAVCQGGGDTQLSTEVEEAE